jgi:hypothetical protein
MNLSGEYAVMKLRAQIRIAITGFLLLVIAVPLPAADGNGRENSVPRKSSITTARLKEMYREWRRSNEKRNAGRTAATSGQVPVGPQLQSVLIDEGFEGATFPPAGWSKGVLAGSPEWDRSTSSPHNGLAAAYTEFGPFGTLSQIYLVTPR